MFNYHWIFDFQVINKLFYNWELQEFFVDEWAGVPGITSPTDAKALGIEIRKNKEKEKIYDRTQRFSKSHDVSTLKIGEYKIIYLHFKRRNNCD